MVGVVPGVHARQQEPEEGKLFEYWILKKCCKTTVQILQELSIEIQIKFMEISRGILIRILIKKIGGHFEA